MCGKVNKLLVLAVLAYAIAAACATVDAANAALPAYVLTLQFFVGLLIRIADIPGYALLLPLLRLAPLQLTYVRHPCHKLATCCSLLEMVC